MKLKKDLTLQKMLKKALFVAKMSMKTNRSLGIIHGISIMTTDDKIQLSATDLKVFYITETEGNNTGWNFYGVLSYDDALMLSKTKDKLIFTEYNLNKHTVKWESGLLSGEIKLQSGEDFPMPPVFTSNVIHDKNLNIQDLLKCQKHASTDTAKSILTGTLYGRNMLASTDGYTLMMVDHDCADDKAELILNPQSIKLLSKIDSDLIQFSYHKEYDNRFYLFDFGNENVIGKAIEGKYPNCNMIYPKKSEYKITMNTKELLNTLNALKDTVNKQTQIVHFNFDLNNLQLKTENGSAMIKLIENKNMNPEFSIAFNITYMLSLMECVKSDTFSLEMNSEIQAVKIEDQNYKLMIMPIKP